MAPRSTSAKPSQAPLTMRSTRSQSRRGTSTQPASPMACSSTTTNRVQKAGKTPSIASQARTRRAASVVSTVTTAPAKPLQKLLTTQSVAIAPRSGYGDAHANREYMGMLEYAKAAHKAGIVDEETLEKMCIPWQEKGVLEMSWKEEYLLDGVKEVEEIMDLKKAEAIARKKDAAEKKYLEEHFGGAGKKVEKKEPLKSVRSGKISKKTSANTSKKASAILPIIIEDDEPTSLPEPASTLAGSGPVQPLPGYPDYAPYGYFQLVSLCFERNLLSGGNIHSLRSRLIQDDINVINNLPREAKPYSKENSRGRKNKAPIVPNAPQAPPAVYTNAESRGEGPMKVRKMPCRRRK